jgi:hypothetical protein
MYSIGYSTFLGNFQMESGAFSPGGLLQATNNFGDFRMLACKSSKAKTTVSMPLQAFIDFHKILFT